MNAIRSFALSLLALWICSCSLAPTRPAPRQVSPEAGARLAELEGLNRGLTSFKGIGNLRLYRPEGRQTVRAAWIAQRPDRLRLELFGPAAAPVARMVANGSRYLLYLPDRDRQYRSRDAGGGLEKVIGVPLKASAVVSLLGGRIFLEDFSRATVENGALVLENARGMVVEKIHRPESGGQVRVVDRFDERGNPAYRVRLGAFRPVDGFSIPGVIKVTAAGRKILDLTIDRFWANPKVAPSVFDVGPEADDGRGGR